MDNPACAGAQRVTPLPFHLHLTIILATRGIGNCAAERAPPARRRSRHGRGLSLDLDVVAKQLDIARSEIQPSLGATVYDFGRQAIETQPQGDNQPFNQLLLQAPGVAQDSFGQLHVRGDHANLQFRINGVICPRGSTSSARRCRRGSPIRCR